MEGGDSQTYIELVTRRERGGILTIYPSFLRFFYNIFGENIYLTIVSGFQGLLGAICAIDFSVFIRKQFKLNRVEFMMTFLLSLLVYTISFPQTISTHDILTEAIAYPLFFIYMKHILKVVLNDSKKDIFLSLMWTLILSWIRGQLQLL